MVVTTRAQTRRQGEETDMLRQTDATAGVTKMVFILNVCH